MNLRSAIKMVIEQNISLGYTPHKILGFLQNEDDEYLKEAISNYIMEISSFREINNAIDKFNSIITIEELIARDKNGLGLPSEVVLESRTRSNFYTQLRGKYLSEIVSI